MLDDNGHEIPDPNPVALPLGFKRPETLAEQIQRMVRTQVSDAALAGGAETFEDADDFDTGDDDDDEPGTPYELEFDPVLGREISADMIAADPSYYRKAYLTASELDAALLLKAENYHKTHVNRARGASPKAGPPDPVAPKTEKDPVPET